LFLNATFYIFLRLKGKIEIAVKRIVLFLSLVFVGLSCDPDNEKPIAFDLELVTIENVRLPEFFVANETYEIEMEYLRPSACHFPNAVRYSQENEQSYEEGPAGQIVVNKSVVTFSVENIIFRGDNCDTEIPENERIVKATLKLKIDQPAGTIYELNFLKEKGTKEKEPIYFVEKIRVITKNEGSIP